MKRVEWVGPAAAALAGVALGIAAPAGTAMLLATGGGLLGTVGLLIALALGALAVGIWAGAPRDGTPGGGLRWIVAIVVYLVAGLFGQIWLAGAELRGSGVGGAFGALVLLAAPAYVTGSVLALLRARRAPPAGAAHASGALAVAALLGAAAGTAVAGGILIPRFDPAPVLFAAAAALAGAGAVGTRGEGAPEPEEANAMSEMRDRAVVVTGVGARGQVGYAVAEAFLEAGAKVLVTDVTPRVETLADELSAKGEVAAVRADLTRADGAGAVVGAARERFGRLDVLVNVAGGLTVIKPVAETSDEEWSRELDRNGRTTFVMSRAALPLLRESRGAIVNFASPAGIRAMKNFGAYSAGKATVVALTRSLALEERRNGVRVNAIAPGMIDTEQNRAEVEDPDAVRWVTREQIADAVLFLAGDAASGITGETVHVLG